MNGVWSSVCLCGNCGGGCCCWYFDQQNTALKRENYKLVNTNSLINVTEHLVRLAEFCQKALTVSFGSD